ncbi:hypothetical protein J4N42_00725 [Vibrio sp. SCSIO 43135]|uniref:hypothetical protein n=1 Tax=Vibrio sp. SCSIO 43135 TaxID=2819096 RepID=UPI00207584A1|nr:hypothetical protein [Vibrio sp. SCSIO 43135]USD41289.1 hypothetical protein J4N42_00725 [Vibrio sp. SCSIO 43135]
MTIVFLNDKSEYNFNYRAGIINELIENKIDFESVGFFDGFLGMVKYVYLVLFSKRYFISSNIKSNIIFMLFFWRKGTVIVNGMGRKRTSQLFRFVLKFLFKINGRKNIVFQNYADYRYFNFLSNRKHHWVPGSGGTMRTLGKEENIVIVSRDSKIPLISKSISIAFELVDGDSEVIFVGCSKHVIDRAFGCVGGRGVGFLPQDTIFGHGYKFFQPSGYGEGVPHTLVDAICSGMKIYIYKNDYIKFGLYKLGFTYSTITGGILQLHYNDNQKKYLSEHVISLKYLEFVDGFNLMDFDAR